MTTHTWGDVRALRADPPGHAHKGDRRKTFSAALEQAERLWAASLQVGAAASPMLKFYALSQAGRAISASHGPKPNGWRPKPTHGLAFEVNSALMRSDPLNAVTVRSEGEGLAQLVARTTGSPLLQEPVQLATLLATTPTAFDAFPDKDLDPDALPVLIRFDDGNWIVSNSVAATVGPVPPALLVKRELLAGPTQSAGTVTEIRNAQEIRDWLATYPSLATLGPPLEVMHVNPMQWDRRPDPEYAVRLIWPRCALPDWQTERAHVDWLLNSDQWSTTHDGLILPAVAGNETPVSALMGWWLILYGLSMLSRYYPESWVSILDVDTCPLAVPMTRLSEIETRMVPSLIYGALINEPRPHDT